MSLKKTLSTLVGVDNIVGSDDMKATSPIAITILNISLIADSTTNIDLVFSEMEKVC